MDLEITDHLLTTTRSVRKRLDFSRAVEPEIIERCLEIAIQAPSGSNRQGWQFIVITDPEIRLGLAEIYRRGYNAYRSFRDSKPKEATLTSGIADSSNYLAEHFHEAPVFVLFAYEGRVEQASPAAQAGLYGSILPAAWSFMLALRARGLGTAWTTIHLNNEQAAAELLGLPANYTQAVLFPVAYYTGEDFKPAQRAPLSELISWNRWGNRKK